MAALVVSQKGVRLANTHNVLTRTRPLAATLLVGECVEMDASGNWIKADGTGYSFGVVIGITDGKLTGGVGDDAEVLMFGVLAGFTVAPGALITVNASGQFDDAAGAGIQQMAVGMDNNLLLVRPDLLA